MTASVEQLLGTGRSTHSRCGFLFCFFFLSCGDELLGTFKQDSVGYLYHLQTTHPLPIYICAQHVHSFMRYVLYLVLQSKYFCSTRAISYRVEWNQQTKVNSTKVCSAKKKKSLIAPWCLSLLCKLETMVPGLWKSSFTLVLFVSVFTVSSKV